MTDSEYKIWKPQAINREIRLLTITVMFSALAVASTSALIIIPNLETLTLIFFLVSYRYGIRAGVSTVLISTIIYEFIVSTLIGPSGIIFFFKFPPYLFIAFLGGFFGLHFRKTTVKQDMEINQEEITKEAEPWSLLFGIIGMIGTLLYDISTTLGFLVYSLSIEAFFFSFMIGLPFTAIHCLSNFVMFFFIPQINKSLDRVDVLVNT
ncbi:MAG: hypothetical protein ACFFC7_03785 [Candidatus Hermodarchaeota archaeon]